MRGLGSARCGPGIFVGNGAIGGPGGDGGAVNGECWSQILALRGWVDYRSTRLTFESVYVSGASRFRQVWQSGLKSMSGVGP